MFTKLNNTMRNMTWKAWLMTSLWFSTLIVLFAFVFTAALMEKGGKESNGKLDSYSITVKATDFKEANAKGVDNSGTAKVESTDFPSIAPTNSAAGDKVDATPGAKDKPAVVTDTQSRYVSKISGPTSKVDSNTKIRSLTFKVAKDATEGSTNKAVEDAFKVATFTVRKTHFKYNGADVTLVKVFGKQPDSDAKAYQNGLAGTAALFTVLIFGALGTTVGIKFYERKHSKGGAK